MGRDRLAEAHRRGDALMAQWAVEDEAEAIVEDEAVRQFVLRRFSHNRPSDRRAA